MPDIGFAKVDITPRAGVEMSGFGPYLHRVARSIHDRIHAKAMAVRVEGEPVIIVSCDLIEVQRDFTEKVRSLVQQQTGIGRDRVMLHFTHTHSGPAVCPALMGWGEIDVPYMYWLPARIAKACVDAIADLSPAKVSHAEVPCEGIGYNREYDNTPADIEAVLTEGWQPEKPELTDTTCHVISVEKKGKLAGFATYFSCHPVVCCALTTSLHGDFCGVALNAIENENNGVVGLFLQGAQGDVNSCVVHRPEDESMRALDVLSKRFASSVENGLAKTSPIDVDKVACVSRDVMFSRLPLSIGDLTALKAKYEATVADASGDEDKTARLNLIFVLRYEQMIERLKRGEDLNRPAEMQGFRMGPISLLSAPLEIFQAIKRDVVAAAPSEIPLVMGITNDTHGYAPDNVRAKSPEAYTVHTVATILGELPFADIHDELASAMVDLDRTLH